MNKQISLYLDFVRFASAVVVLLSHFSDYTHSIEFMSGYGVQAVDIFFVLSGYVIAYVVSTKEFIWNDYVISRASRIYSVAIPAIIITLLLDFVGKRHGLEYYGSADQGFTAGPIIRSVLFLNELWDTHRFPGSDSPYWSLGFEVWYYISFGVFIFCKGMWKIPLSILVLVICGPKIIAMLPIWLLGVFIYHLSAKVTPSNAVAWLLAIVPVFVVIIYEMHPLPVYVQAFMPFDFHADRLLSYVQDYIIAGAFACHIFGMSKILPMFWTAFQGLEAPIRWLSGATFSIYLFHVPVMRVLLTYSPFPIGSPWLAIYILGACTIICFALAEVSERRKRVWRIGTQRLMASFTPAS